MRCAESGSRQMDRESIGIYGLWAPASPLKIGIYCDCFGPVSIGTIDGIFSLVLTSHSECQKPRTQALTAQRALHKQ